MADVSLGSGPDGTGLAQEVRERGRADHVIIMTGAPTLSSAVAALRSGACDYVEKPFSPEKLARLVASKLARH